jgi:hypothetical protein
MNYQEQVCNSTCAGRMQIAERELSAFIRAVTQRCGPEEGQTLDGGLARRVGVDG